MLRSNLLLFLVVLTCLSTASSAASNDDSFKLASSTAQDS